MDYGYESLVHRNPSSFSNGWGGGSARYASKGNPYLSRRKEPTDHVDEDREKLMEVKRESKDIDSNKSLRVRVENIEKEIKGLKSVRWYYEERALKGLLAKGEKRIKELEAKHKLLTTKIKGIRVMKATILSVDTIRGKELKYYKYSWNIPMQEITTDKGVLIDNKAGRKGEYWRAPDYSKMIGKEVEFDVVDCNNNEIPFNTEKRQWLRLPEFREEII